MRGRLVIISTVEFSFTPPPEPSFQCLNDYRTYAEHKYDMCGIHLIDGRVHRLRCSQPYLPLCDTYTSLCVEDRKENAHEGACDYDKISPACKMYIPGSDGFENMKFMIEGAEGDYKLFFKGDKYWNPNKLNYKIKVRMLDTKDNFYMDKALTINVSEINVPPHNLYFQRSRWLYPEASVDFNFGSFQTIDSNKNQAVFEYMLVFGNGSQHNYFFKIDNENGAQMTSNPMIYETGYVKSIRVRTTDPLGLYFERSILVDQRPPILAKCSVLGASQKKVSLGMLFLNLNCLLDISDKFNNENFLIDIIDKSNTDDNNSIPFTIVSQAETERNTMTEYLLSVHVPNVNMNYELELKFAHYGLPKSFKGYSSDARDRQMESAKSLIFMDSYSYTTKLNALESKEPSEKDFDVVEGQLGDDGKIKPAEIPRIYVGSTSKNSTSLRICLDPPSGTLIYNWGDPQAPDPEANSFVFDDEEIEADPDAMEATISYNVTFDNYITYFNNKQWNLNEHFKANITILDENNKCFSVNILFDRDYIPFVNLHMDLIFGYINGNGSVIKLYKELIIDMVNHPEAVETGMLGTLGSIFNLINILVFCLGVFMPTMLQYLGNFINIQGYFSLMTVFWIKYPPKLVETLELFVSWEPDFFSSSFWGSAQLTRFYETENIEFMHVRSMSVTLGFALFARLITKAVVMYYLVRFQVERSEMLQTYSNYIRHYAQELYKELKQNIYKNMMTMYKNLGEVEEYDLEEHTYMVLYMLDEEEKERARLEKESKQDKSWKQKSEKRDISDGLGPYYEVLEEIGVEMGLDWTRQLMVQEQKKREDRAKGRVTEIVDNHKYIFLAEIQALETYEYEDKQRELEKKWVTGESFTSQMKKFFFNKLWTNFVKYSFGINMFIILPYLVYGFDSFSNKKPDSSSDIIWFWWLDLVVVITDFVPMIWLQSMLYSHTQEQLKQQKDRINNPNYANSQKKNLLVQETPENPFDQATLISDSNETKWRDDIKNIEKKRPKPKDPLGFEAMYCYCCMTPDLDITEMPYQLSENIFFIVLVLSSYIQLRQPEVLLATHILLFLSRMFVGVKYCQIQDVTCYIGIFFIDFCQFCISILPPKLDISRYYLYSFGQICEINIFLIIMVKMLSGFTLWGKNYWMSQVKEKFQNNALFNQFKVLEEKYVKERSQKDMSKRDAIEKMREECDKKDSIYARRVHRQFEVPDTHTMVNLRELGVGLEKYKDLYREKIEVDLQNKGIDVEGVDYKRLFGPDGRKIKDIHVESQKQVFDDESENEEDED